MPLHDVLCPSHIVFNKHAKNQENIPSLRPSDGKLCLDKCPTTTVSGKNAKCTEALPECYETLHIHSMCQNGFPCKNSSVNSFPKSRGLRFRPRKSVYSCITVSAKNSKCTKALPECYETLQINYMCYYGCPCKNSSGN